MHNGTIIAEVTKRAKESFGEKRYADASPDEWDKHWLAEGRKWHKELLAEGAIKTADTLDKHLAWFERNRQK